MVKDKITFWVAKHWMWGFTLGWGMLVGLPFLAPVFMNLGLKGPGVVIYGIYSLLCHQLPERSFFLFGSKSMYSLAEIQQMHEYTIDPFILRGFIGNASVGWKVAWSDRMVSMYTAMIPLAWVWYAFRKRLGQLPLWGLGLFLLPMAVDGGTHMVSDFAGLGQGFRYTNAWLAEITGNVFASTFYAGDALGSFNSWMRLISGVLFAAGIVWFGFPYIQEIFDKISARYKSRFEQLQFLSRQTKDKLALDQ